MLSRILPEGSFIRLITELYELLEWSRDKIYDRMGPMAGPLMAHTFRTQEKLHKPMADHFNGKVRLVMGIHEFREIVDEFMETNTLALNNLYENLGSRNRLEAKHRAFFERLYEAYFLYDFSQAQQIESAGKHDPLTCAMCQDHLQHMCEARKA